MKHRLKPYQSILLLFLSLFLIQTAAWAECRECEEVAKGEIPEKFLDTTLKTLPSGIVIWDVDEAINAFKDQNGKYLWVDTRPVSFFKLGTLKDAVHMVCDKKGQAIPEDQHGPALTRERLIEAMAKVDADPDQVTVVFFCQGPKCHRSYDAALRSVSEYGLNPARIVWFRAGYPFFEKHIVETPKLSRKMDRYLRGDILKAQ